MKILKRWDTNHYLSRPKTTQQNISYSHTWKWHHEIDKDWKGKLCVNQLTGKEHLDDSRSGGKREQTCPFNASQSWEGEWEQNRPVNVSMTWEEECLSLIDNMPGLGSDFCCLWLV